MQGNLVDQLGDVQQHLPLGLLLLLLQLLLLLLVPAAAAHPLKLVVVHCSSDSMSDMSIHLQLSQPLSMNCNSSKEQHQALECQPSVCCCGWLRSTECSIAQGAWLCRQLNPYLCCCLYQLTYKACSQVLVQMSKLCFPAC